MERNHPINENVIGSAETESRKRKTWHTPVVQMLNVDATANGTFHIGYENTEYNFTS